MLRVRTDIDLVVVFKTGEFDAVPLFVELDHLTPQNYRVLFLLLLLDLRINLIIFHALHGSETDLDVAG